MKKKAEASRLQVNKDHTKSHIVVHSVLYFTWTLHQFIESWCPWCFCQPQPRKFFPVSLLFCRLWRRKWLSLTAPSLQRAVWCKRSCWQSPKLARRWSARTSSSLWPRWAQICKYFQRKIHVLKRKCGISSCLEFRGKETYRWLYFNDKFCDSHPCMTVTL